MTITERSFIFMAAALVENGGIGYKNGLPWSIPGDWSYFEHVTTKSYGDQFCIDQHEAEWSNVVIMGRLSYESRPMLCEPLANRYNIVVSRNPDYQLKTSPIVTLATSLNHAFDIAYKSVKDHGRVFILGGEEIYRQSIEMEECTHVLITEIHSSVPVPCDTFIPTIDSSVFQRASHEDLLLFLKDANIPKGRQIHQHFEYEFVLYVRRK